MWKNPHGRIKEPKKQYLNNVPKSYHIYIYIYIYTLDSLHVICECNNGLFLFICFGFVF